MSKTDPPPPRSPKPAHLNGWAPDLNPTQQCIFDEIVKYVLAWGEKFSGKTMGCLHALIRHCYEEEDALGLIIAKQIRTGKEGVLRDFEWALDIWRNGNWERDPTDPEPEPHKKRLRRKDSGCGLDYTDPSMDANTKDRVLFIGNRHGGWSKVILMSIPYPEAVDERMRGMAPSFVYVDEITTLESRAYFTYIIQQVGRRRLIKGPQQYMASCNPAGPSHWVYKVFFEEPNNEETGEHDTRFSLHHVPLEENAHNAPPGYLEDLRKDFKDETDFKRMILGEWIDRASGDAIFKDSFRPEFHLRGDAKKNLGLIPLKGFPIFMCYDPGPVNFSVHFLQMIPSKDKGNIWIVFDELNYVGRRKPDFVIVPRILDRMDYWNKDFMGGTASFVHIADEEAFSHVRLDGTYDALRIKQLSNGRIKLRACPKGKDSVPARVGMVIAMFLDDTLFISARLTKTKDMLELLVSEEQKKSGKYDEHVGLRPRRSPYIHVFDSLSYALFYFRLNPAAFNLQTQTVTPQVYRAGGQRS